MSLRKPINMFNTSRLKNELKILLVSPPNGIKVNIKENSHNILEAEIIGPKDCPYEGGVFKLEINVVPNYPFEPPDVTFITPIYHPSINSNGKTCFNMLRLPPIGIWTISITLGILLTNIRNLLHRPKIGPDDAFVRQIAKEILERKEKFEAKAKYFTKQHATVQRHTDTGQLP